MSSIAVRLSTPSSARHNLTLRTSFPPLRFLALDKPETLNEKGVRPSFAAIHPRKRQKSLIVAWNRLY